jgi:hypothetical protein
MHHHAQFGHIIIKYVTNMAIYNYIYYSAWNPWIFIHDSPFCEEKMFFITLSRVSYFPCPLVHLHMSTQCGRVSFFLFQNQIKMVDMIIHSKGLNISVLSLVYVYSVSNMNLKMILGDFYDQVITHLHFKFELLPINQHIVI